MIKKSVQALPRPRSTFRMRMTNILLSFLLRSPLHKRVSKTLLLLTFRGRKSGKKYAFPVGYIHEGIDDLIVLAPRKRSWWKNVRSGAAVIVYVQGKKRHGLADVAYNDHEMVAQGITTFLDRQPEAAPMYRIELDASGKPTAETLQRVIPHWLVVRIHLIS